MSDVAAVGCGIISAKANSTVWSLLFVLAVRTSYRLNGDVSARTVAIHGQSSHRLSPVQLLVQQELNPGATKRTIHFARWLHFARQLCQRNQIQMYLLTTDLMVADIFTKPLDPTTFRRYRDYLMTGADA